MKKLFIVCLLLTSCAPGNKREERKPAVPVVSRYDLQYSEDVRRGVICYRFEQNDGIFCFKKSDLPL